MTGEFYYNDLDSRDMAGRGYDLSDEALEENLVGMWDDDSPAHRAWMNAEESDISSALAYIETSDDSFDSLDDFEDLDEFFRA